MKQLFKCITLLFLIPVFFTEAFAQDQLSEIQFYTTQNRPAGLNWQELKTPHFRIIYPAGYDSLAYRSGAILEQQYPSVQQLVGGNLKNFPVVLNSYNDLSNGFVTPYNFRTEVDLAPFKGKGLNPRSGDWLENVLPHELVHANHANVKTDAFSIPNMIGWISPDIRRSLHYFVPYGMHEGIAVIQESDNVFPGAGRGNYLLFNNRFNSNFASPNRWNMGQNLQTSTYTLPYNRHYISGYTFMDWLQSTYGEDIIKESINFHYEYFYLGYGLSLRKTTGYWPGELYDQYTEDIAERENDRLNSIDNSTDDLSLILDTPKKGEELHAPKWISNDEILYYGAYYNSRIGFYRLNLSTGDWYLEDEHFAVSDFYFDMDRKNNQVLYGSYRANPLYPGMFVMDLSVLDLKSGKSKRLTKNKRLHSPTLTSTGIYALQTDKSSSRIVRVGEEGNLEEVLSFTDAYAVSLKANPSNRDQLAVVVNRRGQQALWITTTSALANDLKNDPDIALKDASVADPEWHPDGDRLLFTGDIHPAMNIYEYVLDDQQVYKLTSSRFNAFEASYSPDGSRIAYVTQKDDERRLAVLNQEDLIREPVDLSAMWTDNELQRSMNRSLLGEDVNTASWEQSDYRSGLSWLKPRMILPVLRENAGTTQAGAQIQSIDPLSSQSYVLEFTGIQNRLWYDFTYTNRTFLPGFRFNFYSDPSFFNIGTDNNGNSLNVMEEERGISASVPFNYLFRGDTRLTSFSIEPEFKVEQVRYFDLSPTVISDFENQYKASVFSQFNLGILSRRRDIQPASGLVLFGLFEKGLNSVDAELTFPNGVSGTLPLRDRWALYAGSFLYVSPLRSLNQSLMLDSRVLIQSDALIYNTSTIIPMGFKDNPFPSYLADGSGSNNSLGRLSTRYTIPLFYPDNGGLTLPLYLSSIYLTAFSHTITDINDLNYDSILDSSRSIFGAGLHFQFRVSNVAFDLGVGLAYEATRNETQFIFGQF
ncbi:TolB family protein [Balneola sp. MJW-20]|uniref:TolB family protein n=1 Tax=Gracilimonas aurantiaca TaxID=3234185 RepID=UPI0034659C85